MFIRSFQPADPSATVIPTCHGNSTTVRVLLKQDGLGCSLSATRCGAGTQFNLWHKNHWRANVILDGELQLTDLASRQSWSISAGEVYCVGPQDRHRIQPTTDVKLAAVFNPPLYRNEQHDEDGAYPPTGETPPGPGA